MNKSMAVFLNSFLLLLDTCISSGNSQARNPHLSADHSPAVGGKIDTICGA
jgi:hypothetical protein